MSYREALHLSQETQDSLDYLANHDIKAVAFPVLVEEGPFTTAGLARATGERANMELECVATYPVTYYAGGFATISEGLPHRGQPRRIFTATREEIGLAAVGAMLGWSEQHDMPIMTALSMTASNGSRAPVNTIQLLEGLLSGANVGELTNTRYKKTKVGWSTQHNVRLKRMVEDGLVETEETTPQFKILDPEYKGTKPFAVLHPNQQKVYRILKIAQAIDADPARMWGLAEIEDLATLAGFINKDEPKDQLDFHNRLVRVISSANSHYSPGVTEKVEIIGRRYSIATHFKDAAADLVERVIQLDTSASMKSSFLDIAKEIYLDPTTFRRIATRGVEASPFINANR